MSQGKETIVSYLTSVPAWYLSTVEETPEGPRPHVRLSQTEIEMDTDR